MRASTRGSARLWHLALAFVIAGSCAAAQARAQQAPTATEADADPWPSLTQALFASKAMVNGDGVLALDAPYRALDAAVVPISIRVLPRPGDPRTVRRISLVVDGNPSPLAATFTLGEHSGIDFIATRVRVDDYTNVHAVAELSDGKLYVVSRYVKAAGGCSAPALKQVASAIPLGTMRFRELPHSTRDDAQPGEREMQFMIRHPNYSGMQMDQLSRLYIPADFVESVQLWQGNEKLVSIESGIAISENPEFRFRFKPDGDGPFRAEAKDSDGKQFEQAWKGGGPAS